jgi:transposase
MHPAASEKDTGKIYGKRKIDVEPVFGFLKAHLCFTRFSVRSIQKVENELGFALMAVNIRKFTARTASISGNFKNIRSKKI